MLKTISLIFATLILATSSHAQVPFAELLWRGQAIPFYGEAKTPIQAQILEQLRQHHQAERWATMINSTLRLKSNLGIGFTSCGAPNAFFDGRRGAVTVCLELLELMAQLAKNDQVVMGLDRTQFAKIIDGALWGVLLHELAHAVIAIDNVPITGREEDVADQFMAYFAVNFVEPRNTPVITPTIWLFGSMSKNRDLTTLDQDGLRKLLADEHSLDMQRSYNLACWAYGGNRQRGQDAVDAVGLPAARLDRCPAEWNTLANGVQNRFQRLLKVR